MTNTLGSLTHTYKATGVYTVALTVSGSGGSDTETKAEYNKVDYGVYYLPIILKDSD
jgi:PKD repeat protein